MPTKHNCPSGFLLAALFVCASPASHAQRPLFASAPDSPIPIQDMPGNIVAGDVNGDAKPDLAVVSGDGITVLLGKGDGRFAPASASPVQSPVRPTEMVLGDFTGDGKPDLAIANHDSYNVIILVGDGNGGFAPRSSVVMKQGQHPHTHGLNVGDLNGDGRLDLVTVNSEDNDVSIALGDGKGNFTPGPASFPVGPSPYPGALGDLNGDGHLDVIATTTSRRTPELEAATRALTVLFGDGQGEFTGARVPIRTILPWFVAVGDLNGDRKPDLVATHAERNELTVLLGDGQGGFAETAQSPYNLGRSAWRGAIADLNADAKPDLAFAAGDGIAVLLGDGQGSFQPAPGAPFPAGKGTWQLALGDFNADNKPDLAATNLESDSLTILLAQ